MKEFEIKAPQELKAFFKFFLYTGIISALLLFFLYFEDIIKKDMLGLLILSGFFMILGILGLYVIKVEKFFLKDNIYGYIKPFLKDQFAEVEKIDHVEIKRNKNVILVKVKFISKDNEVLISFIDDGTSFQDGVFLKSLKENKIPYRYIEK